jgi:hypothetical protein
VPHQAGAGPFAPRGFGLGRGPQCAGFPRGPPWRQARVAQAGVGIFAPSGHALSSGGVARLGFLARRGCGVVSGPAAQPGAQADAGCAFGLRG